MEMIIKLISEVNPQWSVMNVVGCCQSKIWCKYKRNEVVKKEDIFGSPRKLSKCQDRKLKVIWLESRKCTTKQMKTNGSEHLWVNCKKLVEWNEIFIEKSPPPQNSTNTLIEENEVKVD